MLGDGLPGDVEARGDVTRGAPLIGHEYLPTVW